MIKKKIKLKAAVISGVRCFAFMELKNPAARWGAPLMQSGLTVVMHGRTHLATVGSFVQMGINQPGTVRLGLSGLAENSGLSAKTGQYSGACCSAECGTFTQKYPMKSSRLPSLFLSLLIGLLVAVPASAADSTGKSALETDPGGWEDIMPSPDLAHWIRVAVPATHALIRDQWHVQNGMLVCDGDGGHDMLLLDRELADGIFHVEFRFVKIPGKAGYNSGVFIRTSRDGTFWHQAQVGSLSGGYFFGVTPGDKGNRNFNVGVKPSRVKEAGEWNTFELTARGSKLTLWANGFLAAEFADCGQAKGYIGLEGEGFAIEFRNLKLKELR
ncbi:MAG TPA: DUF1080 domain-containing protein [Rariglobus sp.]|nr:DUF1080 domain-containing protein [Rariglobus sp.]